MIISYYYYTMRVKCSLPCNAPSADDALPAMFLVVENFPEYVPTFRRKVQIHFLLILGVCDQYKAAAWMRARTDS